MFCFFSLNSLPRSPSELKFLIKHDESGESSMHGYISCFRYWGSKIKLESVRIFAAHNPALFVSHDGNSDCCSNGIICFISERNSSSLIWLFIHFSAIFFGWFLVSISITPIFIKWLIAFTNSVSDIASSDHHPAVFFTHSGTVLDVSVDSKISTCKIFSITKNLIAFTNSVSDIASSDHHPAVFFTHSGTDSANAKENVNVKNSNIIANTMFFIFLMNNYLKKTF